MEQHEMLSWKYSPYTQEFKKSVEEEILSTMQDVAGGVLLQQDSPEKLAREYAFNMGYMKGLKYLLNFLEVESNDDEGADS